VLLGALGMALALGMRVYVVWRIGAPALARTASIASVLAMLLTARVIEHAMLTWSYVGPHSHFAQAIAWGLVPATFAAWALVHRPRAGLAFVSAWWVAGLDVPFVEPWVLAAPIVTLALAIRDRRVRMPITWAAAGLAVGLASTGIAYDQIYVGEMHDFIVRYPWGPDAALRMSAAAIVLLAGRALLADRTWALLALIAACVLYAGLPAPHFEYPRTCMPGSRHPLDGGDAPLFLAIAATLLVTWAAPLVRALRPSADERADQSAQL